MTENTEQTTEPQLSIQDQARLVALASILSDQAKDGVTQMRDAIKANLAKVHRETGVAGSVPIHLPGTSKPVAKIAFVPQPDDKTYVADEAAFAEWVAENHETEVEIKVVVRPSFRDYLLEHSEITDEGVVDPASGELIPGLGVKRGSTQQPSIRLTWTPKIGKTAAAEAVHDLSLAELLRPALEAAPTANPVLPGEVIVRRDAKGADAA